MGSFRRTVTEHLLAELPPGSKVASFSSTSDGILVYIGTAEGESWGAAPSSISGSVFVLFNAAADVLSRCHGVTRLAWGALLLSPPSPSAGMADSLPPLRRLRSNPPVSPPRALWLLALIGEYWPLKGKA